MVRKSKNSEEENLSSDALEFVIQKLESKDPASTWTKKACCEYLKIAYNTTRLNKLLEEYKEKKRRTEERRKALRGKPATSEDIKFIAKEYLLGAPVSDIAQQLYRSTNFVENVLEECAVPRRGRSYNYDAPELIPENAMADKFEKGEVVYSMRYDSPAIIDKFFDSADSEKYPKGRIYRVWLTSEKWQQYAYQPVWELASLKHLRELGVVL